MATTRLGSGGYGIRRAGSFADKTATEAPTVAVQGIGGSRRGNSARPRQAGGAGRSNIQRSTR